MTLALDLGFNIQFTIACRVYGVNAPELVTPAGKAALAFTLTLVSPGDHCTVVSHGWDKYGGRFDGTLTLADGRDFGATMLAEGFAVIYP
jgi:endonuclease YncB( thermonuclease family)